MLILIRFFAANLRGFLVGASLSFFLVSCDLNDEHAEQTQLKFEAGEHIRLGDMGYKAACEKIGGCPSQLLRADAKESFGFGELVAFSADFYPSPEHLYFEKKNRNLFHPFANDLSAAKALFDAEEDVIKKQLMSPDLIQYPDNFLRYAFAYFKFLELAANSLDHFGWYNMKAYIFHHQKALDMATNAYHLRKSSPSQYRTLLTHALFIEAFADHFLTDAFATGHLRNPRTQSITWQKAHGHSKYAVQFMTKLLHDHDHLLKDQHGPGLLVSNHRGDVWRTRCDGELFLQSQLDDSHIAISAEAIEISVSEVLIASLDGTAVAGTFKAAELVPFLHPDSPLLTDAFDPEMPSAALNNWLDSLGSVSKLGVFFGLNEAFARTYFQALPAIMENFRQDVQRESQDPVLLRRLPAGYIEGFQKIR